MRVVMPLCTITAVNDQSRQSYNDMYTSFLYVKLILELLLHLPQQKIQSLLSPKHLHPSIQAQLLFPPTHIL